MLKKLRNAAKSRTTQNSVAGSAVGGSAAYAIIRVIRSFFPDLPGDAEADAALVLAISTVIVPLCGRLLAFWRNPDKRRRSVSPAAGLALLVGLSLALGSMSGCVTVEAPDGTITTRPDVETLIRIQEAAVETAQLGLTVWETLKPDDDADADAVAVYELERAKRQQRLDDAEAILRDLFSKQKGGG